jgi:lysophospholipase L1-like esterase
VPAPAAASVLVVGDSLEVGTGPYLRQELAGIDVTIDARRGRPSSEGVDVLGARLRPEHDVVVFDLGTNDDPAPGGLAANLRAARGLADGRCLVVASLNRPPLNGVPVDGLDAAVRDFVAETPNAQLVDWRAATSEPGVLAADGVHGTPEGYALRARLVAEGVQACLASGAAPLEPLPAPRPRARRRGPELSLPLLGPDGRGALHGLAGAPARLLAAAAAALLDVVTPGRSEPVLGAA